MASSCARLSFFSSLPRAKRSCFCTRILPARCLSGSCSPLLLRESPYSCSPASNFHMPCTFVACNVAMARHSGGILDLRRETGLLFGSPWTLHSMTKFKAAPSSNLSTASESRLTAETFEAMDGDLEASRDSPTAIDEGRDTDAEQLTRDGTKGNGGQDKRKEAFPKKGQELELYCESLAFKGMGVCRIVDTGFVIMCERALPGERLIGRIFKMKRGYAEAYKIRTLSPHSNAVEPPCQHFNTCGGCKLQNLAYSAQLEIKEKQVAEMMQRMGRFGLSGVDEPSGDYMRPIVPCSEPYYYRNKMEFSFGSRIWLPSAESRTPNAQNEAEPLSDPIEPSFPTIASADPRRRKVEPNPHQFALGLHAPRRFDKILPIESCMLQHPVADQILTLVQAHCKRRQAEIPPYDALTREGFLRHLTIRTGRDAESGSLQLSVNITTKEDKPELLKSLADEIVAAHPQVVSVVNNINSSLGDSAVGGKENLLVGQRSITERLRGLDFEISASSFFQTNTRQAEVLYALVEAACSLKGDGSEVLLDLFCGTGTIGLSMASKVDHVYGYELNSEAVADARRNAERNGIKNASFFQGDLNKLQNDFATEFPRPDVVITDPNRPGMHPKLLRFLNGSGTSRIVYVSCNPATCVRDIDILCHGEEGQEGMYRLKSVQPVDMFPQTPHVECVVVLERKELQDAKT